ncbi:Uncharacterized protein FWK35_00025880 [Aphis craccivora]|uniref:Uncharacterized protein n=1 Tax=Aphis craccivora TaxID=307492 RepID=A0A6G0XU96_APHCR|nr:Uncharacterized protein FWK35_00025880 [Aphis craccivora]
MFHMNSERSDECIDFTMLCFFFFFICLCTRERVEIMLQFQTLKVVSYSKMNLVGALKRSFFELPNSFQKLREKPKKKNKEKREFLRKTIPYEFISRRYLKILPKSDFNIIIRNRF